MCGVAEGVVGGNAVSRGLDVSLERLEVLFVVDAVAQPVPEAAECALPPVAHGLLLRLVQRRCLALVIPLPVPNVFVERACREHRQRENERVGEKGGDVERTWMEEGEKMDRTKEDFPP